MTMLSTINYCFPLTFFIIFLVGIEIQAQNPVGSCPNGTLEDPNNHVCFKFMIDHKSFSDAENSCYSMGGHLAVVNTMFTNNFLAGELI